MNLEEYLISKKIDPVVFKEKEPELWKTWNYEFETMHPNSFTIQKLNLINPIRRKYPLKSEPVPTEKNPQSPVTEIPPATPKEAETTSETTSVPPPSPKPIVSKPAIPRPVFKPKPKTS
jgi:hypothetical protein